MLTLKRGDTWQVDCVRTDSQGAIVSLTGVSIASKFKIGAIEHSFAINITNASQGEYSLEMTAADSAEVLPRIYECDVEFTEVDGTIRSSVTFNIQVVADIT